MEIPTPSIEQTNYLEGTSAFHAWKTLQYLIHRSPNNSAEDHLYALAEIGLTHLIMEETALHSSSQETLADKL